MTNTFKCFRIREDQGSVVAGIEDLERSKLADLGVLIEAHYSSLNFKDALAGTGRGKILKKFPLIGGIDVAGKVISSKSSKFHPGDSVLVTGCGLGETQDGGYSELVSVPESSVVSLPEGLSLEESMIIGTAGFTAALCLHRLEQNGQSPQKGPVVVTGASGGVGSLAIDILAKQGYEVWAISGKKASYKYLQKLGARKVLDIEDLELGTRPLESVRFAGAIDNLGGEVLAGLLRHVELWGNVASVGLALDHEIKTSIMPFILRGVSLLGISSNNCPMPTRIEIWRKLSGLWKPKYLEDIHTKSIGLSELPEAFEGLLARKVTGRITVKIRG